jgi:hypothetical protein
MSRSSLAVRTSLAVLTCVCLAPSALGATIAFESVPQSSLATWAEGAGYYGSRQEFIGVRFTIDEPTVVTGVESNLSFDDEFGENPLLFVGIEALDSASSLPRYDPLLGSSVFVAYAEAESSSLLMEWQLQTVLDPGVYALVLGCAQLGCITWYKVAEGELLIPPENFLSRNVLGWHASGVPFRVALLGVPEPATGGMLLVGLLLFSRRRRPGR